MACASCEVNPGQVDRDHKGNLVHNPSISEVPQQQWVFNKMRGWEWIRSSSLKVQAWLLVPQHYMQIWDTCAFF